MKKIALVTVTYNTAEYTNSLLESIKKIEQDGLDLNIIIVDNGSKDVFKLEKGDKDLDISIFRIEKNIGFTGGYNKGLKEALKTEAEYILILNNDTQIRKGLIKNLKEVLKSDNRIGVTTPKIYFAKGHEFHKDRYDPQDLGRVLWFAGGEIDWNNVLTKHRGLDEIDNGQYNKTEEVEFATGCCMMFKREVLEKVGLFDERYFLYYEDADLNERIKRNGYKIYYVHNAELIHNNASSTGGAGNVLHDYFLTRNKLLFGMTYASLRTKLALLRESFKLFIKGRKYQKLGVKDYYIKNFGKGSFIKDK